MLREIARPRPDPVRLVVKNGSKMRARSSGGMPVPRSVTTIEMPSAQLSGSARTTTSGDPAADAPAAGCHDHGLAIRLRDRLTRGTRRGRWSAR